MTDYKRFQLIYLGILILIITISILLYVFMNELVAFVFSLVGITIAIIDNILKPFQKDYEDKIQKSKKVKELFNSVQNLLEYLESRKYWESNEKIDEKINTIILRFSDNIEDLRKYFGFNIINEERGKYNKKITIMEGRFIITFRNHIPFESYINKKGRIIGPFKLQKDNTTAQEIKDLMYSEIIIKLRNDHTVQL